MKQRLICVCGAEFFRFPSQINRGKSNFCSPACRCANQPKKGLAGTIEKCVCGNTFYVEPGLKKSGKGRFCSIVCKRANMTRRSGLKYNLKVVNRSWFKPGDEPLHKFPKGTRPHNFKDEGFGYATLHDWVKQHKGKALKCEQCGSARHVTWANKSWEYKRDLDDWMELCSKCHHAYDRNGGWGLATAKFPELRRRKSA